eukprot:c19458_g1_i1 orf=828-1091(+)
MGVWLCSTWGGYVLLLALYWLFFSLYIEAWTGVTGYKLQLSFSKQVFIKLLDQVILINPVFVSSVLSDVKALCGHKAKLVVYMHAFS